MNCHSRKTSIELTTIAFFCWPVLLPLYAAAETTRHYYIAAEEVVWEYAPVGQDLIHGGPIPDPWANNTRWPGDRCPQVGASPIPARHFGESWSPVTI